jgi:TPP-dependent pyruvate/acetoin dehydrogenase alpha subunit
LAHDKGLYRDPIEVAKAQKDDCIKHASNWLESNGVASNIISETQQKAALVIAQSVLVARQSPLPSAGSAYEDVQDLVEQTASDFKHDLKLQVVE